MELELKLDKQQELEITNKIDALMNRINKIEFNKPYLNKTEASKYFDVAPATLSKWATLGMPVAVIDGYKLYGKESITNWLKSKEQTKKPLLLG
ncbi:hypothetical protein J2Z60_002143 [Lactobacillus colini]|uniref:DNA-packaging protein n=1 Tax=Lactobacillus colini TaxID=1819254 RepID=A0ABS4MHY1_9LACO|nr:DNA-binding protein [Lactobacillus colini]MBP2058952.1 hypothetical protein [Lactobacillus colini]